MLPHETKNCGSCETALQSCGNLTPHSAHGHISVLAPSLLPEAEEARDTGLGRDIGKITASESCNDGT